MTLDDYGRAIRLLRTTFGEAVADESGLQAFKAIRDCLTDDGHLLPRKCFEHDASNSVETGLAKPIFRVKSGSHECVMQALRQSRGRIQPRSMHNGGAWNSKGHPPGRFLNNGTVFSFNFVRYDEPHGFHSPRVEETS